MDRKIIKHPFYTVVYLSFVFFAVIPVFYTISTAFFFDGSISSNLALLDKDTFFLLGKSSVVAFFIASFSTVLGTLFGFLLYKTNTQFRNIFKIILLIPLFISPYILAVAWKDFFFFTFKNVDIISSYFGVILVLTTVFTPLSILIIGSALSNIDSQLEDTGLLITNLRSVILKIILPLIKPALVTSFVLVFVFSISEFSVPAFFGVKVFTTEIFTQFSAFYNHSLAIIQSALLVMVCVLLLYADRKHISDAPFFSIGGSGTSNKLYNIKKWNILSFLLLTGWFFISIMFPFVVLFIQSFNGGTDKFIQAFKLLIPTFGSSIWLAFAGALIIVIVGFTAAYYSAMHSKSKTKNSFNWILLILFAIPSTIFGISLIKFYNHTWFGFIYSSYAIIIIGYVGKFSFISAKLIGNAIKQIPNSLDEAAQIEGVTHFTRLRKILVPLIMPTLFVAFVISFIFSLGELGTTIMLYPPGTEIMPIKVFTIMANAPQALTSSMTLIVFLITLLIISLLYFSLKRLLKL